MKPIFTKASDELSAIVATLKKDNIEKFYPIAITTALKSMDKAQAGKLTTALSSIIAQKSSQVENQVELSNWLENGIVIKSGKGRIKTSELTLISIKIVKLTEKIENQKISALKKAEYLSDREEKIKHLTTLAKSIDKELYIK